MQFTIRRRGNKNSRVLFENHLSILALLPIAAIMIVGCQSQSAAPAPPPPEVEVPAWCRKTSLSTVSGSPRWMATSTRRFNLK